MHHQQPLPLLQKERPKWLNSDHLSLPPSLSIVASLMEDSKLIATRHLLRKGAILLSLLRRVLSWVFKLRYRATAESLCSRSAPSSSCASSEIAGDGLPLATYGDAVARRLRVTCDTCAVCFSPLVEGDEVRVLRNCCHLYHRECLDRWVGCDPDHGRDRPDDHGSNHRRCPLCRAPLWAPPSRTLKRAGAGAAAAGAERRWSVKRLRSSIWGCDL
ncbi:hypothetical protein BT93_D1519 [Corymbia citriodora subsp. variegata]|nr:hypothetical protein BT93_D1519 [Corymbia citriodora subsp. variegata]